MARHDRRLLIETIVKGDAVLVHGQLVRRFYWCGAGARSLTEVVATGIKRLDPIASAHANTEELDTVSKPA